MFFSFEKMFFSAPLNHPFVCVLVLVVNFQATLATQ